MTNTILVNKTSNMFCVRAKEEWLDDANKEYVYFKEKLKQISGVTLIDENTFYYMKASRYKYQIFVFSMILDPSRSVLFEVENANQLADIRTLIENVY